MEYRNRPKRFYFLIILLSFPIVFWAKRSKAQNDRVKVWAAPAEQKIRPSDPVETKNIVWAKNTSTVQLSGAGNEHVPFQVIISIPDLGKNRPGAAEYVRPEAMEGFFVKASDFTSTGGNVIPSDQIKIYLEHYILLYGKSGPMGATGYWPDALVPLRNPFGMDAEYSVVQNRPMWLDIVIPSEARSGNYTGTITVTQHGNEISTMNIKLRVHDFTLPDQTPFITYMGVSKGSLAKFYNKSTSSEKIEKLAQTYYIFLYDHRMEPWFNEQLQPDVKVNNGQIELSFNNSRYQYYMNKLKTKRVLLNAFPRALAQQLDEKPFSNLFNEKVKSYLSDIEAYFKKHGWEDKLVFNSPIDEPNTRKEYEDTRQWAKLVHEATSNVPFLATESPVAKDSDLGTLRGYVDNFSIHGNDLNDPKVKQAIFEEQKKGGEMTWYISCDQGYPQPNYFIDAPAMDPVMVPWITARYKMNGILYWATNYWSDTPNPWKDAVSFNSGFLCSDGYVLNGEGYFFYPGDYAKEYTGQPDVNGPVSSIRFELLREGIEDYIYLSMLRNLGAEDFAEQRIRNLVVDVSAFSRNRKELYQTRKEMAKKIEEMQ